MYCAKSCTKSSLIKASSTKVLSGKYLTLLKTLGSYSYRIKDFGPTNQAYSPTYYIR